jgi:hypothetical protein
MSPGPQSSWHEATRPPIAQFSSVRGFSCLAHCHHCHARTVWTVEAFVLAELSPPTYSYALTSGLVYPSGSGNDHRRLRLPRVPVSATRRRGDRGCYTLSLAPRRRFQAACSNIGPLDLHSCRGLHLCALPGTFPRSVLLSRRSKGGSIRGLEILESCLP